MNEFQDRITAKLDEYADEIPLSVETTGRRAVPIVVSYEIPIDEHDDFFAAYTTALHDAFIDLVIEYRKLITGIEEAFEESLDVYE